MRQRTLYRSMGLAVAGMALGIALGVAGVDPASHWVFSGSCLALLVFGAIWAARAWASPENRPLLRLMAVPLVGVIAGWIAGTAGAKAIAEVVFPVSLLALVALFAASTATRGRARPR